MQKSLSVPLLCTFLHFLSWSVNSTKATDVFAILAVIPSPFEQPLDWKPSDAWAIKQAPIQHSISSGAVQFWSFTIQNIILTDETSHLHSRNISGSRQVWLVCWFGFPCSRYTHRNYNSKLVPKLGRCISCHGHPKRTLVQHPNHRPHNLLYIYLARKKSLLKQYRPFCTLLHKCNFCPEKYKYYPHSWDLTLKHLHHHKGDSSGPQKVRLWGRAEKGEPSSRADKTRLNVNVRYHIWKIKSW